MSVGRDLYPRPAKRNRDLARELRKAATPHERILWRAIRDRLPPGVAHFRRQVCLGPYIVDFCDLGARLVVEVDGDQHGEPLGRWRDAVRDEFLRAQRFRVLRFTNADVRRNLNSVMDTIFEALTGGKFEASRDPHP